MFEKIIVNTFKKNVEFYWKQQKQNDDGVDTLSFQMTSLRSFLLHLGYILSNTNQIVSEKPSEFHNPRYMSLRDAVSLHNSTMEGTLAGDVWTSENGSYAFLEEDILAAYKSRLVESVKLQRVKKYGVSTLKVSDNFVKLTKEYK